MAGVSVFLEPGLDKALRVGRTSADGSYVFANVAPGVVGVIVIADGYGYGGASARIALGEERRRLDIHLDKPGLVAGTVSDAMGEPVANVQITHMLILGDQPAGIPLSKLQAYGLDVPRTDDDGRFLMEQLPRGAKLALKFNHIQFAQETVTDVGVGDTNVKVTLDRGVFVMGQVRTKASKRAVANASIVVRSTVPPHDSIQTRTGATGEFALRLKPGTYLYQAASTAFRSPGWERLDISGERSQENVQLYVAGIGEIRGKVLDAISNQPVEGARFTLKSNGNTAAIVRTGPGGEFLLEATEGENILFFNGAPGYGPPETKALKTQIVAGKLLELPEFWLVPIPTFTVQIFDPEGMPAPGVVVRVVRPEQFGWRLTDHEGLVSLSFMTLPEKGPIVGMAESRRGNLGALFAIDRNDRDGSVVQLMPLTGVKGQVVNEKGKGVEGAIVGAVFTDGVMDEPIYLWRTLSRRVGYFDWRGVIPHVAQRCIADAPLAPPKKNDPVKRGTSESMPFTNVTTALKDLGSVVIPEATSVRTTYGKTLRWYDHEVIGGALPDRKVAEKSRAVVVYTRAEDAAVVLESVESAQTIVHETGILFVVVVDGEFKARNPSVPVLRGRAPGPATTYVVGLNGKVELETFGLPPLLALYNPGPASPA